MRKIILFAAMACCLMADHVYAGMTSYCQGPPFISATAAPNVLLMVDTSGSMGWNAYSYNNTAYDPTKLYEGYFDPTQDYVLGANGVYTETGTSTCSKVCTGTWSCKSANDGSCLPKGSLNCNGSKYACCTQWATVNCGSNGNGNYLNYRNMTRIDLVRWALTGGSPDGCNNSIQSCDPEVYPNSQLPCDATGCTITSSNGVKVKARWDRLTGYDGGLLFQLKGLPLQPRLGGMFFSNNGVNQTVLLGDFTGSNNFDAINPYKNTITSINDIAPNGATPIGPALWAAYAYLAQQPSVFGSPSPQSGTGDKWKNPMYQCFPPAGSTACQSADLALVPCAKNFIILLTDGQWNTPSCSISTGYESSSSDPVVPAYWLHKKGFLNVQANLSSNVEDLYSIGLWLGGTGAQSLQNVSMYGSFATSNTWPGNLKGYPLATCSVDDCGPGQGSPCTALPPSSSDWDTDGNNIPDTFFNAADALEIKNRIMTIVLDILKKASSGTAVSVLSSNEGSGANLMQALFYPKRSFAGNTDVSWTSDMMDYWYYMDPFFNSSQIREDTVREGGNAYTLLDLTQDYITNFTYDSTQNKTMAHRWWDTTGTGSAVTDLGSVPIESTIPIWRAGFNLWWTDPTARNIYTSADGSTMIPFDTTSSSTLANYLGETGATANATINYVRGYDCVDATGAACVCGAANCSTVGRSRTVTNGVCSARRSPCNSSADCPSGETCAQETHTWKLGDIISSTPRIMGPGYLDNFNAPAPFGYNDQTYSDFIKSNDYANRQLVFVGANDGMLHAFKLGNLIQNWAGKTWYQAAKQVGSPGAGGIGSESYAFIPTNTLPYLQYLQDPDYCHIYMVDGSIALTDASLNKPSTCTLTTDYWNCPKLTTIKKKCSITTTTACAVNTDCPSGETCVDTGNVDFTNTSWRTVLIGSMGIGGATGDGATPDSNRISTPFPVSGNPVGWSSYFALDVTDQTAPQLLWEFGNAGLGATNVGAAIVKVGGNDKQCTNNNAITCTTDSDCGSSGKCANVTTNGRWFAILASGSTGPISNQQFMGTSDQNLKLFVLDLKTGTVLRTIDTGIANAFAGSISTNALDLQKDRPSDSGNYQDNAVYIGYVQNTTSGGVLRLVINDDINPADWTVSPVINNIGPVTTSVVNLLDRRSGKLWLYFAEGRYFYKQDDLTTQRKIFGIQEPCFDATNNSISPTCTTTLALTNLQDQTTQAQVCSSSGGACTTTADCPSGQTCVTSPLTTSQKGWYVNMAAAVSPMSAERVVSNPTPDPLGAVYFLSFAPNADICSFGGTTYLWALDYKTGGKVPFLMRGKALIQVSTGEIKELNLSSALTDNGGRKSVGFNGIPPTGQGLMVVTTPPPMKEFMHIQEK